MLLDAPTAGPTTANIRRVFGREDAWYFTTSREIYSYGLQGHRWHRYYLDFGYQELPEIADIVLLEPGDPGESVTVTTSDGRFFVGTLSPKNGRIPLVEMTLPPPDRFDATAEDLLDVQDRGDGYWTFLLQDRIKRFDPRARRWLEDERLPGTDATYRYGTAAGLPMLTARDPGTGAEQWWLGRPSWRNGEALIPFEPNPDSTVTTAIASNGDIWELHKDQGLLRRCHVQQAHEPQRYECKTSSLSA